MEQNQRYRDWSSIKEIELKNVKAVCFDIDDTITSDGKLMDCSYQALWRLKKRGFILVPITGRPAGHCDHIARFWPVDSVIGENGAFSLFMKDGKMVKFDTLKSGAQSNVQEKMEDLKSIITKEFPNVSWASDQFARLNDLAVDICEDVFPWGQSDIDKLLTICEKRGARAKLSSIHVNIWFGNYDKALGFKMWLNSVANRILGFDLSMDNFIYIGDSPNDVPMFKEFKLSVGVANLLDFVDKVNVMPTWLTSCKSADGFCEFANRLCRAK